MDMVGRVSLQHAHTAQPPPPHTPSAMCHHPHTHSLSLSPEQIPPHYLAFFRVYILYPFFQHGAWFTMMGFMNHGFLYHFLLPCISGMHSRVIILWSTVPRSAHREVQIGWSPHLFSSLLLRVLRRWVSFMGNGRLNRAFTLAKRHRLDQYFGSRVRESPERNESSLSHLAIL